MKPSLSTVLPIVSIAKSDFLFEQLCDTVFDIEDFIYNTYCSKEQKETWQKLEGI